MKKKGKKILLADPDVRVVRALNSALKAQGWDMTNVKDGTRALELALAFAPDFIIMEIDLPFLNGVRVAQILRSNPNMDDVPIIFMSSGRINPTYLPFFENSVIQKPFNVDEVVSKLDAFILKREKAVEIKDEAKEIEGNLSQMSIVDILQIFSMNKKDGVIVVRRDEEGLEGMIFMQEGEIVNATIGCAKGEKALYRLLTWNSGKFEYIPANFNPEVTIEKNSDSLMMEGMRQLDEWKRMAADFPPMDSLIYLKIDPKKFPSKLRPVTREVIALLEFYKKVGDVIDNCSYSDYETMMTIHTLVSKGVVELKSKEVKKGKKKFPILSSEEAFAIKEKVKSSIREKSFMDMVKVPILADTLEEIREIVNLLAGLEGFMVEKDFFLGHEGHTHMGTAGSVKVSDSITLIFPVFPLDRLYSPIWAPLMGNSVGAVIVRGESDDAEVLNVSKSIKEELCLNPVVLNFKIDSDEMKGADMPQMNMWDIKKDGADKLLHTLLESFLNL